MKISYFQGGRNYVSAKKEALHLRLVYLDHSLNFASNEMERF